jgi:hypothetical protein
MNIEQIEAFFREALPECTITLDRGGSSIYFFDFGLGEAWAVIEVDLSLPHPFGLTPLEEECMPFTRSGVWESNIDEVVEHVRDILKHGGNKTWTMPKDGANPIPFPE